jgi:hypothetical protein
MSRLDIEREVRRGTISLVTLVVYIFVLSACSSKGDWRGTSIYGSYETNVGEVYEDEDGIKSIISVNSSEILKDEGMDLDATMRIHVHFGGAIEFTDLDLVYSIVMQGRWTLKGDTLSVIPMEDTFKAEFQSSSASRPTEEAMVRHLRKIYQDKIDNRVCAELSESVSTHLVIDSITGDGIWGHLAGEEKKTKGADCAILMRRIDR